MSLNSTFGATPGATISSSVTPSCQCGGSSGVLVHILTTSSLQFQAEVSLDGTNWATQRVVNAKTGAETAAGSNVTPSQNDLYYVPTYGAVKCRIKRDTAGSGTLSMLPVFATDALMDQAVTVSGVSTLAEQQTQTTHLATIAGDTTDIETAVELLDNIVGQEYETVAASQTAQVLGPTGATGDLLQGVLIVPGTTSPGNVIVLDNATSITIFTGGASSVTSLVPFFVPLGIRSVSGAWKVTTGANVTAIGIGDFT